MIPPLISPAARLLYFARRELLPFGIPPHLPLTRAHAERTEIGPTQEDIREFNTGVCARLVDPDGPSVQNDCDWTRLRTCRDATDVDQPRLGRVYVPGSLSGLFVGRMLVSVQVSVLFFSHIHFVGRLCGCPLD